MPGENATRGEAISSDSSTKARNEVMKCETSSRALGSAGAVLAPTPSPASLPSPPFLLGSLSLLGDYFFFTWNRMPFAGAMGMAFVCFFPLPGKALPSNLYFCVSVPSTTLASSMARYCPRQFLGP